MQFSCYIEINLICLILLGIIYVRLYQRRSMTSAPQALMRRMLAATGVLCLSDVVAIISRGRFFPMAQAVIEISNVIYVAMMPVISMLWCAYVFAKLGQKTGTLFTWLHRLPLLSFLLIAATNPLHHLLFSINADNLYVRGPGVFIHWLISWYYLIYAGAVSYLAYRGSTSWAQRSEYRPLLYFMILPAIGCVTQMLFYGVTSVQAGITLSLILVSMQMQDNQISTDELTGINNRKALHHYLDVLHTGEPLALSVMMIDVNRFKQINDTYGHNVGDIALQDTAAILRAVCSRSRTHLFLCRYGGDEFVIISQNAAPQAMEQLRDMIREDLDAFNAAGGKPFALSLSIGCAEGECSSYEDFLHYLRLADETMYDDKKRQR